jgi:hypothetical protein
MFEWLNGPGAVFKDPLPGSTNYLSAYDKSGRLMREKGNDKEGSKTGESAEDRRPFPLNPVFFSEPVLSEELRNHVYKEVVENKKSLRTVSLLYGVELRRVAAVVRLVALEKRMEREV